ncbi:MAG: hypothetical protein ACKVJG_22950 [Candidatus Latescibacterota bacterium]|jgi:hypothetical protein
MILHPLIDEQIEQFNRDGYLIVENCVAPEDTARIRRIAAFAASPRTTHSY